MVLLSPSSSTTALAIGRRFLQRNSSLSIQSRNSFPCILHFSTNAATATASKHDDNSASTTNSTSTATTHRKPRVLILGSGWGGFTLARRLDKSLYDVRVISPANHFLFTPLLPSTAVGTLEFRAIQEPVRTIQGLGHYYQAKASGIDMENRVVTCEDLYKKTKFDVPYDYLCVSAGKKSNTFNTHK